MDQSYVRHLLPRLARKAGIERRVHAHGLRHAFAVDLVRAGAPLYVVRDALGHSSVATTQVYLSSGRRARGRRGDAKPRVGRALKHVAYISEGGRSLSSPPRTPPSCSSSTLDGCVLSARAATVNG